MSTQAGTLSMTISTCNAHEVVAQAVDLQGAHCDKPFHSFGISNAQLPEPG